MTDSSRQSRLERLLYYANSAFLFWALAFIVTGPSYSSALGALLLAALLTLPTALSTWRRLDRGSRFWLLALLTFGLVEVSMALIHLRDVSDLERPLKYVGAALIFLYLARFGFSRVIVIVGIACGAMLGLAHGVHDLLVDELPRASAGHNPLTYGYLMVTLGLLLIFFGTRAEPDGWRWPLVTLGFLGCLGALFSGSKGVVLVMLAAIVAGVVHEMRHSGRSSNLFTLRTGAPLIAAMTVLVAGIAITPVGDRFAEEWQTLSNDDGLSQSSDIRLALWNTGIHLGVTHPFTGAGIHKEQLAEEAQGYIAAHGYSPHLLETFSHFHNEYIDAWAKKGLPGLLALLVLGLGLVWGASPGTRVGLLLFLAVYAVGGISQSLLAHGHGIGMLLLGALLLRTLSFQEISRDGR